MRWPFRKKRAAAPSPDATAAVEQADRAFVDAKGLDEKMRHVAAEAAEIKRVNHIAVAVARSIRGV